MKGGVDEQVQVIQDEGAIDVDLDAASVALELSWDAALPKCKIKK
jgi:hypothetical protein